MLANLNLVSDSTIVALATPPGTGALAIIRLSGPETFTILAQLFKGADLATAKSHTILYGHLYYEGKLLDEVLISVFKGKKSYTKEDSAEISCHGSPLIIGQIIDALCRSGAILAQPGEFTLRAFKNGRFDLAQAEAVADLIHAETEMAKKMAESQMRGGFSQKLSLLRAQLIKFAALIELELDFGEEDVEFANRDDLKVLLLDVNKELQSLIDSFQHGNVLKNGITVVLAGKPNVGKSTLLNAILQEDRALVSEIAGTTRDTIEEVLNIGGYKFRFIDTAGLRITEDVVEAMGVQRTKEKMDTANLVVYLLDLQEVYEKDSLLAVVKAIEELNKEVIVVGNKIDQANPDTLALCSTYFPELLTISAKENMGIATLIEKLLSFVNTNAQTTSDVVVSNVRHLEALKLALEALTRAYKGLHEGLTGDFLALDIRHGLYHLGSITGEVTSEDLLGYIFGSFCIGK